MKRLLPFALLALTLFPLARPAAAQPLPRDDGYRGIWYPNQKMPGPYPWKYSGGMATYPQQIHPQAIYAPKVNKTFFVYGGRPKEANTLRYMVSYFDHATGKVPRPVILASKKTDDAHDNAALVIDSEGHLWVFCNAHGTGRPSWIYRSRQPYAIDDFELIKTTNFSYGQPWWVEGKGFLFLHTLYGKTGKGREMYWTTSADGRAWSDPSPLAQMGVGQYQVSWVHGGTVGTAFNYHPVKGGLNARTNLYYVETRDFGKTWRTADGKAIKTPLTKINNTALVHDYAAKKRLVYMKNMQFDAQGRPVILYLTSGGYKPGPEAGPRIMMTAHWLGDRWDLREVTRTDHNYDFGALTVEPDGAWRIIGATEDGPQKYMTGGEIALWLSKDEGAHWQKVKDVTHGSARNQNYPRHPLNAHPGFYAFWADGDANKESGSDLYFTDKEGSHVWRLPTVMTADEQAPELLK